MKTNVQYKINNNEIYIEKQSTDTVLNEIPIGIYNVKYNKQFDFYFLSKTSDVYKLPEKIYGTTIQKNSNRILNTYKNRNKNTGILLSGNKGSGKSLLAKYISNSYLEIFKKPIIVIEDSYSGPEFNDFINSLGSCCLIFEEFDSIYKESYDDNGNSTSPQNDLLTLFDGLYDNNNLIILTANKVSEIDDRFFNRPGRIYYHLTYNSLPEDLVEDFVNIKLKEKKFKDEIINYLKVYINLNFDMVQAIVEECNLYPELEFNEIVEYLNFNSIDKYKSNYYEVEIKNQNKNVLYYVNDENKYLDIDPFDKEIQKYISYYKNKIDHQTNKNTFSFYLSKKHLIDVKAGKLIYHYNNDGDKIIITLSPVKEIRF